MSTIIGLALIIVGWLGFGQHRLFEDAHGRIENLNAVLFLVYGLILLFLMGTGFTLLVLSWR